MNRSPVIRSLLKLAALCFVFTSLTIQAETNQAKTNGLADLADAFTVDSNLQRQNILESLSLSEEQKNEIQDVLLAGMQSLDVVNAQIGQFEADQSLLLSPDVQEMIIELQRQKIQLAEMMSVEILSILSPGQRSKLNLNSMMDANDQRDQKANRKYEI